MAHPFLDPGSDHSYGIPKSALSAEQQRLLRVAHRLLSPVGILIQRAQALAFGLRLHLCRPLDAGLGVCTLVLYHNQLGQWTRTVVEGPPSLLARAAAERLDSAGPETPPAMW
jgi:hypothetical protein